VLDRLAAAGMRTVAYDARGHGESDAPHEPDRYADARLAADLAEIIGAFAGSRAVIAGYSMGAATILLALCAGTTVGAAVLGGTPRAVLGWSPEDEQQRASAVAILEERETPDAVMQVWIRFLDATGTDKAALAAFLRSHQPVVEHWDRIMVPVVVAAGVDDAGAAPPAEVVAHLAHGRSLELSGDHFTAVATPAFTDAMVELTHAT
jgi:pimeloyl-ACP methyl ester carboxylesterase